jgi:hypothetical protein
MHAAILLVAAASLSVDYGWRTAEDGTLEYIIQVPPEQLARLNSLPIASDIPPEAREATRFVIQVGSDPLPREGGKAAKDASLKPDEPIVRGQSPEESPEKKSPEKKPEEAESDKPLVRGQSTADPYSLPAANQAYSRPSGTFSGGRAAQNPFSRAPAPGVSRQPAFVAQQPVERETIQSAQPPVYTDRNFQTEPARGVWRGEASPTLDPPAGSQPSLDADLAVAERAGRETTLRQVPFNSRRSSQESQVFRQASHDEEVDREPASRRQWSDEEEDDRKSSRSPSPWTITMMLLFASVGGNVWLGYLVWDLTVRFRDVVSDNRRRRRQAEAIETATG